MRRLLVDVFLPSHAAKHARKYAALERMGRTMDDAEHDDRDEGDQRRRPQLALDHELPVDVPDLRKDVGTKNVSAAQPQAPKNRKGKEMQYPVRAALQATGRSRWLLNPVQFEGLNIETKPLRIASEEPRQLRDAGLQASPAT